jgi:hypothetical protein
MLNCDMMGCIPYNKIEGRGVIIVCDQIIIQDVQYDRSMDCVQNPNTISMNITIQRPHADVWFLREEGHTTSKIPDG